MAGEVTLTSSMRSNLYSLQGTASTMATVQQRLASGKKVNSALDNPNSYFAAQSLTNRANDLSALLDGMGQAIEVLKAATGGITAAQKIIDQMKSVASTASQSITTSNATSTATVSAKTMQGTVGTATVATAGTVSTDGQHSLYSLMAAGGTTSLNVKAGDQMTVQLGSGSTYTFTVGGSAADNLSGTPGNGGGVTLKDLDNWLSNLVSGLHIDGTGGVVTLGNTSGTTKVTIAGKLSTELFGTAPATATNTLTIAGTQTVSTVSYTSVPVATATTKLSDLTDSVGNVLGGTAAATNNGFGTQAGAYLSLAVAGGDTKTINFTSGMTVQTVIDQINTISGLTASLDSSGRLKVVNNNSTAVTVSGSGYGLIGAATISANASQTNTIYGGYGSVTASSLTSTSLTNLEALSGQNRLYTGDILTVTSGSTTVSITITATVTTSATQATTVSDLMNALGQVSGISASIDSTTGKLSIVGTQGQNVSFTGTAATKLGLTGATAGSAAVSSTFTSQFDTLRTQLDTLVKDASYKGINLLSGTANNPLTVTFNEAATNANKLTISAVDLTTTGLGITAATGNWNSTSTIQATLTQLTNAATTMRDTASTLGQNLTTVQTRQDFTNSLISTLKEGADNLTLADMNEESANMLALQTRQQLGIQSLSLASQANQAVMRLFG